MDLDLSDDQQMLVESFAALLDKQSRPEDVRAAEPFGFDHALWQSFQELGAVQMAVAEGHGGWGASMLDLCLVSECLGQRCASAPLIESQVTARLLAGLANERLEDVLNRGRIATLALHPPVGDTARGVPAAAVAEIVVARRGDDLVLVETDAPRAPVENLACLPLADVPLHSDVLLGLGPDALVAYERAIDEWLLLTASALVGLSQSALTLAVDYAKERRAFGSAIGAFQGVAHPLAETATRVEGARLLVREAAWSVDLGLDEAAERACMAFAFASEVAHKATYWGVHTLGGYGVMVEYDAQLYFRRSRGWSGVFGDPESAYRRVARHRYGTRRA